MGELQELHPPGLQPSHRTGRLTQEGLFVGASLLHVGARPDSTAGVMHLVHNSTTQKGGKEKSLVTLSATVRDLKARGKWYDTHHRDRLLLHNQNPIHRVFRGSSLLGHLNARIFPY